MLIKIINPNSSTSELSGTIQTGNIIADVDVPIAISGYSDSNSLSSLDLAIQDPAGGALTTLEVQTDGDAGATLPQSFIDDLNGAVEAGVADPYHIPNVSELTVPGAYLHAGVEYAITGLEIS